MSKPISSNLAWPLMNPVLAGVINPLIANPMNQIQTIQNVVLVAGNNIINHKLGRPLKGWFLVDSQNPYVVYRSAPLNATTLTLNSTLTGTETMTVSIGVF